MAAAPAGSTAQCKDGTFTSAASKSVDEAAHTAPGVGLGLALSRRLSRSMNGDLTLDPTITHGAAFILRLPLATANSNASEARLG